MAKYLLFFLLMSIISCSNDTNTGYTLIPTGKVLPKGSKVAKHYSSIKNFRKYKLSGWECTLIDENPKAMLACGLKSGLNISIFNGLTSKKAKSVTIELENKQKIILSFDYDELGKLKKITYMFPDSKRKKIITSVDSDLDGKFE